MKKPVIDNMMRRLIILLFLSSALLYGCSAIQSIVRSAFPYTANLKIPSSSETAVEQSVTVMANSFDQLFTGQGSNTNAITNIRLTSVKLDSNLPVSQNIGVFSSIKIYILRGDSSKELLIASGENIASSDGKSLVLEADKSLVLDDYIKESTVRIKMKYTLKTALTNDISIKASLDFQADPNKNK